jgi:hypothetical protein
MSSFESKTIANLIGLDDSLLKEGNPPKDLSDDKILCTAFKVCTDGSLRGDGARELVFKLPVPEEMACTLVTRLYDYMKKHYQEVATSMRAGVHIHINCAPLTVQETLTFAALYYCLEDSFSLNLSEERRGNLFCLRLADAEYPSFLLKKCLDTRNLSYLHTDNIRYAGLNFASLHKFGSLEFRLFDTPNTPEPIVLWIRVLSKLFNSALALFKSPTEVLEFFSANGEKNAVETILGSELAKLVTKHEYFEERIQNNIRTAQFWVYSYNWKV